MIKNIILHIGVHKTASTTIQNTLFNERSKLAEAGILYPEFKLGDVVISNHSIPFYSLFHQNPEKYHINKSIGLTSNEAIQKLHQEYLQQLSEQINSFDGDTLIISGEDISLLEADELVKLKSFLIEITNPNVIFRVVMMCRHPVTRFRSSLQGTITIFGLPMEKAIQYRLQKTQQYRKLTDKLLDVFGRKNIILIKYEDTIINPYGPAGAFLALIDKYLPEKIKPILIYDNQSRTYETVTLSDAINRTFPETLDFELHPERMVALNAFFAGMPGQKFMLPKGLSAKVWQALSEDVNWLCMEFDQQPYVFFNEDLPLASDIWNGDTLKYFKTVFPNFSDFQKKVFLDALLNELNDKNKIFTSNKVQEIFEFVLFYSKYLQTGSRITKFKYFSRAIGFSPSLKLSLQHIISKFFDYSFIYFSLTELNPRMKEEEIGVLSKYLKSSKHYLEFGLGGSTILALKHSKARVYAVDSDSVWVKRIMQFWLVRFYSLYRLKIYHVNIGQTKEWGFPLSEEKSATFPDYSSGVFKKLKSRKIDLVLIDGRFRVACALQTILNCSKNQEFTILIHDFYTRPQYHTLLKYITEIEKTADLGVFVIKRDINLQQVFLDYEHYKYISE
jgi:hypothetical protein